LFERIAKKGAFPEDIARHHMKSLTQCIQVCIISYITYHMMLSFT
jgi:hypothetical protein